MNKTLLSIAFSLTLSGLAIYWTGCAVRAPITMEPPAQTVAKPELLPVPDKSTWTATSSGSQEEGFEPAKACDGQMNTRWSGLFLDPQWIQLDLGTVASVCGLTIHWEAAYSSEYYIETSLDGRRWTKVYENRRGDGNTDDLYFKTTQARFIRLTGTKRATGWGHSIWEIHVKGPEEQIAVTADTAESSSTEWLFDGFTNKVWASRKSGPQSLILDLQQTKSLGGLRIDWGAGYAEEADLLLSTDGTTWTKAGAIEQGVGRFDVIMHPALPARYIRLDVKKTPQHGPLHIAEISFRGPDEVLTPLALYQLAAEKSEPGYYPNHLLKRQIYWTLVGLPADSEESLLDEYGNLEPKAKSFSLMPYIHDGQKLYSSFQAAKVTQKMEEGYLPLPSVEWTDASGLNLLVEAVAVGKPRKSASLVRYRLSNSSAEKKSGRLFLAVRPVQVNPIWQHGGLSPIRQLALEERDGFPAVLVNQEPACLSLTPPSDFGVCAFDKGDIAEDLAQGRLPAAKSLAESETLSGALAYEYELEPGAQMDVVIAAPLHQSGAFLRALVKDQAPSAFFSEVWQEQRALWEKLAGPVRIHMPRQDIVDMMKAQVSYILINQDGVSIQPGSRNYKRAWIRDGSLTSAGLLKMGLTNQVRDYVDWYSKQVQPDGWVPPILNNDGSINQGFGWDNEYDSQGQYVFIVMEYYRFTQDRAFLERHFDKVIKALEYLVMLRNKTLEPGYMAEHPAPERFAGILPKSISHEGYDPPMHSYWDDYFALKGWKDGQEAALLMGRDDLAQWAGEQLEIWRKSIADSIRATVQFKGIDYIPGCAEKGDRDPTSVSIAFFPCQEEALLDGVLVTNTFDHYYREMMGRQTPGWSGGFTPYEERTLMTFVQLGWKDRARDLLNYLLDCRRPQAWNHLAEVVHGDARQGSYIGDMPHTWVGSGYINSIRAMLAYELDGHLILLSGATPDWMSGEGLTIENLPTYFGALNLRATLADKRLNVEFSGPIPPNGFVLRLPLAEKPARVEVDGQAVDTGEGGSLNLPSGGHTVGVTWE